VKFQKQILVSLVILLNGCVSSTPDRIGNDSYFPTDINEDKTSYFYIDNLNIDKAREADSITCFYTHSEPNTKLIQYFKEFSNKIGNKNGAIIISPNTNIKRAYTLVNEISSCKKVEPTLWPVIVFEDRTKKNCYPLYIQEVNYGSLVGVLNIVQEMISDINNRDKIQVIHNTKDRVSIFVKEHPSLKVIEPVLFKLIELLGEKLV